MKIKTQLKTVLKKLPAVMVVVSLALGTYGCGNNNNNNNDNKYNNK